MRLWKSERVTPKKLLSVSLQFARRRKCDVNAALNSDRDRRDVFIRVIRMIRGRSGAEGEV